MPQLRITITNRSPAPQRVHVFDTLRGGTRPVEGSPFELASGLRSAAFGVDADARGRGLVAYRCDSRITATGIDVSEGSDVQLR